MMNWFFGGGRKSNLPEATPLQAQKAKQIEQLRSFYQGVSEIQRDVEYRVNFPVGGSTVSLYITLPPRFPQDKPAVKVAPSLLHPWVNSQMQVVGCPGINNFEVQSDLRQAIQEIVDEIMRNPPTILPAQQPYGVNGALPYPTNPGGPGTGSGYRTYPQPPPVAPQVAAPAYMPSVPMPTLPITSSTAMPVNAGTGPSFNSYQMPDIPTNFQQLKDLSVSELQQLSDNEDQLLQIIQDLPQMQKIASDRSDLCKYNEDQARKNLTKKPILEEKKQILLEKYDLLNDLRRQFDDSCRRQESLRGQFDPSALQANLKVAAQQAEEQSENIADNFLDGKLGVDEFRQKFMEMRTLSHLRRAKEEKLTQFVTQSQLQSGY